MDIKSNVNIFFIHPLQGMVKMLEPLASLLPAHVWGLQHMEDCPYESLQEIAKYYIQHIKSVQLTGPYIISSYSYGASLCFEMSLQLEKAKETVIPIMLDGSVYINVLIHNMQETYSLKRKFSDEISSLSTFLYLCGYTKHLEVLNYLFAIETWEEQVKSVSNIVSKDLNIPEDQVKQAVELFNHRFVATHLYKPTEKIIGDMILIKSNHFKDIKNVDKLYLLNEACLKQVILYEIDDSHYGIIQNEESLQKIRDIFETVIKNQ